MSKRRKRKFPPITPPDFDRNTYTCLKGKNPSEQKVSEWCTRVTHGCNRGCKHLLIRIRPAVAAAD